MVRGVDGLVCFHDTGRLPGAFTGREDGRRLCLRPVEAHDEVDRVVRRGQPVGFLVLTGRIFLDVERQ